MKKYTLLFCTLLCLCGCASKQNIHLSLTLPQGYRILQSGRPSFVVYDQGKRVKSFYIQVPQQTYKVKKGTEDRNAIAKAYYCPVGQEGLCIIHDAFFKFDGTEDNVRLEYDLPEGR